MISPNTNSDPDFQMGNNVILGEAHSPPLHVGFLTAWVLSAHGVSLGRMVQWSQRWLEPKCSIAWSISLRRRVGSTSHPGSACWNFKRNRAKCSKTLLYVGGRAWATHIAFLKCKLRGIIVTVQKIKLQAWYINIAPTGKCTQREGTEVCKWRGPTSPVQTLQQMPKQL